MGDISRASPTATFARHVGRESFPCLAAKTALARDQVTQVDGGDIRCGRGDRALAEAIAAFAQQRKPDHVFHSLVVHFPDSPRMDELAFEGHLFNRLQGIHEADRERFAWDPSVSADPSSPQFSMSVGGKSFYVIGLHPGASRAARRLPHPALVFNLHAQFEYLRERGRYDRLRTAIIERDLTANGSINPMLAVHGESSEARQYSGRVIEGPWECPFHPAKAGA
jgi:FPC/CPF motif-containing protein YcgG